MTEDLYKVTHLDEASYLHARGLKIIKYNNDRKNKITEIWFENNQACQQAILDYHNGVKDIAPNAVFNSHHTLKKLLYVR